MWDANTIDAVINDTNEQVISWYSVITGKPIPQPAPAVIQSTALARAADQAPTTALLVSQPLLWLGVVALALVVLLRRRE